MRKVCLDNMAKAIARMAERLADTLDDLDDCGTREDSLFAAVHDNAKCEIGMIKQDLLDLERAMADYVETIEIRMAGNATA